MCEVVELSSRKKNSGCNKAKNMNTTSYYVDVSFFFLTEYNTTEQEQE